MRVIEKEIVVDAAAQDVWSAWTTREGIRSFFAPDADIELAIGGKYEIFFNHTQPYGNKGSEGCIVLDFDPGRHLSFTWNAPPSIPALRAAGDQTRVDLRFTENDGQTNVMLHQAIEQEGGDWNTYYQYFAHAWGVVLARLQQSFASGPIDWNL